MMTTRSKALAMVALIGAAGAAASLAPADGAASADPYANLPSTLQLTGVVRDFKGRAETGGHPDFELTPSGGYGHYMQMVADQLDSAGKPAWRGAGNKVSSQWRDAAGRNRISNKSYISAKAGDVAGAMSSSTGGAATSSERFAQWYRDVPGVNVSRNLAITLVRQPGTNMYTFNDRTDAMYQGRNGFFPINGELLGNFGSTGKNFHFTYEISTTFIYERGKGQVFTFTGDDDVWVFVDGKLVIDLGGVHGATTQSIEMDRLNWLVDGREYSLKVFQAERHTTESNFRIDTTMRLRNVEPPTTTALFD